jgi:hypothetical protein
LIITGDTLTWFQSSDFAERGFCSTCGSNLFWRRFGNENVSVWAGTLDGVKGLRMEWQIHTESKGDYYELPNVPIATQKALK